MKKEIKEKLDELLKIRKECVDNGWVWALQEVNLQIAKIAKKLKLDYYTLA